MNKKKCAVIGAGFIGAAHVEALRRLGNVEVAALCDALGAEDKAARLGIDRWYSDYRAMMDELPLDVVHICTPNYTHYEIAKCAIEHGVHFVCEKPFTMTIEQARELTAMAEKKGIRGAVNFHSRMYPMVKELRDMICAGELGEIFTVHGEYIQDWLLYETDYSWRLEGAQVGKTRAIADIGSHWLDMAEFVTGLRIRRVMARFRTVYPVRKKPAAKVETFSTASVQEYSDIPINTEDAAVVLLEFSNGAIGSLVVSQVFAGRKNSCGIKVAGSRSAASWDSEDLNHLWIGNRDRANGVLAKDPALLHSGAAAAVSYPGGHIEGFPDAFKQNFKQFYASLAEDGTYDYATIRDGLREMELCEAIFDSAQSGRWVTLTEETMI